MSTEGNRKYIPIDADFRATTAGFNVDRSHSGSIPEAHMNPMDAARAGQEVVLDPRVIDADRRLRALIPPAGDRKIYKRNK